GMIAINLKIEEETGEPETISNLVAGDYFHFDPKDGLVLDVSSDSMLWTLSVKKWEEIAGSEKVGQFLSTLSLAEEKKKEEVLEASRQRLADSAGPVASESEEDDGLTVADFQCTPEELKKIQSRKPYSILQHDEMDCGAACMTMISRF